MGPPSLRLTALFCLKWLLRRGGRSMPGSIAGSAARVVARARQLPCSFTSTLGNWRRWGGALSGCNRPCGLPAVECVAPRRTLGIERVPDISCRNPAMADGRFFSILPRFPNVPQAPIAPIQPVMRQGLTATESLLLPHRQVWIGRALHAALQAAVGRR